MGLAILPSKNVISHKATCASLEDCVRIGLGVKPNHFGTLRPAVNHCLLHAKPLKRDRRDRDLEPGRITCTCPWESQSTYSSGDSDVAKTPTTEYRNLPIPNFQGDVCLQVEQ